MYMYICICIVSQGSGGRGGDYQVFRPVPHLRDPEGRRRASLGFSRLRACFQTSQEMIRRVDFMCSGGNIILMINVFLGCGGIVAGVSRSLKWLKSLKWKQRWLLSSVTSHREGQGTSDISAYLACARSRSRSLYLSLYVSLSLSLPLPLRPSLRPSLSLSITVCLHPYSPSSRLRKHHLITKRTITHLLYI